MDQQATILPFPPQLRLVAMAEHTPQPPAIPDTALVKHYGRTYRLAHLMACLSPANLAQVEEQAPRNGQAIWDAVVRNWPAAGG